MILQSLENVDKALLAEVGVDKAENEPQKGRLLGFFA